MDMNFLFYLLYQINLIKLSKLEITFIIFQKYHAIFANNTNYHREKKSFIYLTTLMINLIKICHFLHHQ